MKFKIHPLPYGFDVAFSIRDDDISYFTPAENLDSIYQNAWNLGFKTSLAVIPAHKAVNTLNVPINIRNSNKYYKIYQNANLVKYLKKK